MEDPRRGALNEYARNVIRHKARQLIGKCGFTHDDYEDLQQEMLLDLLMRLPKFDPSKASYNTFVARIVDRKISNLIRDRGRQKRDHRCQVRPLDEEVEGEADITREEMLSQDDVDLRTGRHDRPELERIEMRLDVARALADLPPDLKALAERLLSQSVTEAARDLGVPRSTLYGSGIARLRKIFEEAGLTDCL